MTQRLAGKTAFITAAGQGIGRATAIAFAAEGARVIATDINAAALASLSQEIACSTYVLDVTNAQAVRDVAEAAGPVDVLFNAAGFVHAGSLLDCTEDEWSFAFDLNLASRRWPASNSAAVRTSSTMLLPRLIICVTCSAEARLPRAVSTGQSRAPPDTTTMLNIKMWSIMNFTRIQWFKSIRAL